ncbi:MAG: hypothetical protein QF632_03115 [Candidatus Woesearchaeota archaeon]|jgi:hypothetical protein|nr:hypothetical protein [Candidatus Woesearchaeota archaeon]MDP7323726.1 hypothetical protein [Candidatus Woesearchaeota archaeon]MDP7457844.1 hypothetical protein [Candidatus Woesearchaeota archaeon]|tara:strand:+ start:214 stop:438 length:225 start_codon:yes stop_codon:yes gene_type:complete
MKLTSIQLHDTTKKKLEQMKKHPKESFDAVVNRIIEMDDTPSMEEMFRRGDAIKQKKIYSTEEIIKLTHRMRNS